MHKLLFFIASAAAMWAQDVRSWSAVEGLRAGEPVTVISRDGKALKGPLGRVTQDSISVAISGSERGVARGEVARVELRSDNRRLRNLLIGAGIGVASGLVLDRTWGTYSRNETGEPSPAIWVAPIAAGAGLGALFPSYRVVYRAPRK